MELVQVSLEVQCEDASNVMRGNMGEKGSLSLESWQSNTCP